jgi:hypothetical protein
MYWCLCYYLFWHGYVVETRGNQHAATSRLPAQIDAVNVDLRLGLKQPARADLCRSLRVADMVPSRPQQRSYPQGDFVVQSVHHNSTRS